MLTVVSIIVALGFLCLTVYGLHKYQAMEVEYSVDRSMPLPPLDRDTNAAIEVSTTSVDSPLPIPPETKRSDVAPPARPQTWNEELAELKKAGDILGALALCEHEFPLWGAYNQACIVLRAKLRSSKLDENEFDVVLTQLYRTAATAELLHDKSPQTRRLTLNQIKQLKLHRNEKLDMPHSEIGYAHLRLIKKGDIKLMRARWGRPLNHSTPRQLHQAWWEEITGQLS